MDYKPDGSHLNIQMSRLSTSVCQETGLWDVTMGSELYKEACTDQIWNENLDNLTFVAQRFQIIQQTVRIFAQVMTAMCLCWGLGLGLMHIWIWWHSLDKETCLIPFQHATYLPQGRERCAISTDQYVQHVAICILQNVPLIEAKAPRCT